MGYSSENVKKIKELYEDKYKIIEVEVTIDENGKYVLPDRTSYVKVQLP